MPQFPRSVAWARRFVVALLFVACTSQASAQGARLHVHGGHQNNIVTLAFSPDESLVATGGLDSTVRLWHVPTGREVRVLEQPGAVRQLAFSRDGALLAVLSVHSIVRVYRVADAEEVGKVVLPKMTSVDIASDRRALVSLEAGLATFIDSSLTEKAPGEPMPSLLLHGAPVVFSALIGEDQAVSVNAKGSVRTWRLKEKQAEQLAEAMVAEGELKVAVSANRQVLAVASAGKQLHLFRLPELTPLGPPRSVPSPLSTLALNSQGTEVLLGTTDANEWVGGEIQILELGKKEAAPRKATCGRHGAPTAMAVSRSGGLIACAAPGRHSVGPFWILDASTGRETVSVELPVAPPAMLQRDDKSTLLVVGSHYGRPTLWPTLPHQVPRSVEGLPVPSYQGQVALSADGSLLAATDNLEVLVHSLRSNGYASILGEQRETPVNFLGLSADGTLLVVSQGGELVGFDVQRRRERFRVRTQPERTRAFAFDRTRLRVATAGMDGLITVSDSRTGRQLAQLGSAQGARVLALVFDSSGQRLLASYEDAAVIEWQLATRRQRLITNTAGGVVAMALSSDGKKLAIQNMIGELGFLDSKTGEALELLEKESRVKQMLFLDTPRPVLVTAGRDGAVRLWDARSGEPLARLMSFDQETWAVIAEDGRVDGPVAVDRWVYLVEGNAPAQGQLKQSPHLLGELLGTWKAPPAPAQARVPELVVQSGHPSRVRGMQFSPGGELLASVSGESLESELRVWDLHSGKELWHRSLRLALGPVFSPDQSTVALCADGKLELFEARTGRSRGRTAADCIHSLSVFDPAWRWVATSQDLQTVLLKDPRTGATVRRLEGTKYVEEMAVSHDGKWLAARENSEGKLWVWNVDTGQRKELSAGGAGYTALAFQAGSHLLAAGNAHGVLELWDVERGLPVARTRVDPYSMQSVHAIASSPDGATWVVGTREQQVYLLDANLRAQGQLLSRMETLRSDEVSGARGHRIRGLDEKMRSAGLKSILRANSSIEQVAVSAQGQVAGADADGSVLLWDLRSQVLTGRLQRWAQQASRVRAHPRSPWVGIGTKDDGAKLLDLASGRMLHLGKLIGFDELAFTHNGNVVVTAFQELQTFDTRKGAIVSTLSLGARISSFALSSQERFAAVVERRYPENGYRLVGGTLRQKEWDRPFDEETLHDIDFNPRGSLVAVSGRTISISKDAKTSLSRDLVEVVEASSGKRVQAMSFNAQALRFVDDNVLALALAQYGSTKQVREIALYNARTGQRLRGFGYFSADVSALEVNPDRSRLLAGDKLGNLAVFDIKSGRQLHSVKVHAAPIRSVGITGDGRFALTVGDDLTVRLTSLSTGQVTATLVLFGGTDYLLSAGNAYLSTRGTFRGVSFRLGGESFPLEQFDLVMNRPEQVLAQLGYAPKEVLEVLRKQQDRRARKMGAETELSVQQLPELSLVSSGLTSVSHERTVPLRVRATAASAALKRLHLFVNDVPMFGAEGRALTAAAGETLEKEVAVRLSAGRNKVQLYVEDEAGRASLRLTRELTYVGPAPRPTLHVVVVGVSQYADARYNLQYAAKDAGDLASYFESLQGSFGEVKVTRLLDQEVTRERVLALKEQLLKSEVDDSVVVFFAGHGLLDKDFTYYFAPSDIDVKNPAARGISFEQLESLVDGIPARHKLLLIDTCHAGELEREELLAMRGSALPGGVRRSPVRALELDEEAPRRAALKKEWMIPELLLDLRRGSGATVIAAAGGAEYAYESGTWKNGVFTHAVIAGLRDREADANEDQRVSVAELREFVTARVATLTGGRQRPVSRRENMEFEEFFYEVPRWAERRPEDIRLELFSLCEHAGDAEHVQIGCPRLLMQVTRKPWGEMPRLKDWLNEELKPGQQNVRVELEPGSLTIADKPLSGFRVKMSGQGIPTWRAVRGLAIAAPSRGGVLCLALDGDEPTLARCSAMMGSYAQHGLPEYLEAGLPPVAP